MKDWQSAPAVLVDEREGRARDTHRLGNGKPRSQALDEEGFSGSEVALQTDDIIRGELGREGGSEGTGGFGSEKLDRSAHLSSVDRFAREESRFWRRIGRGRVPLALAALLTIFAGCEGKAPLRDLPLPAVDGPSALLGSAPLSPRIANYTIEASYASDTHRLAATSTLRWKNSGSLPVDVLPFHLYMNAFKNSESLFYREVGGTELGIGEGSPGWGWIQIDAVAVGGKEQSAALRYPGPDETVVELPLEVPLPPGETIEVEMSFRVQLPRVQSRTGYADEFAMVAQWYPKIGVRRGEGAAETWHCPPFHAFAEFFADFGTYNVVLDVPPTHRVAATGVLVAAEDRGPRRRLHYRAEDVHDFAWAIDPHMDVIEGAAATAAGSVTVRVYHRPAQRAFAERHLRAGIGAIRVFSRMLRPYPWRLMSIVSPPPDAGAAGGMEYPTLVTTGGESAKSAVPGILSPEIYTVHEVGHNWFQGMLASDEVDEPWLDEGINEYATGVVMNELYGATAVSLPSLDLSTDYFAGGSSAAESPSFPILSTDRRPASPTMPLTSAESMSRRASPSRRSRTLSVPRASKPRSVTTPRPTPSATRAAAIFSPALRKASAKIWIGTRRRPSPNSAASSSASAASLARAAPVRGASSGPR